MSDAVRPAARRGFLGRRGWIWTLIAGWFVPAIMTIAYFVFALLSDLDAEGFGWMSVGLLFVYVLWWMMRLLSQTAALARAVAVGDADGILEIANHALAGKLVVGRAQLVLHQAIAYELRGDWARALDAVARADVRPTAKPKVRVLAATLTIASLVETGEIAQARGVLDAELAPLAGALNPRIDAQLVIATKLARGRVLVAEHANAEALAILQQVIDDVRAGAATRAVAKTYAARAAAA